MLRRLNRKGQGQSEYGLILGLVAIIAVGVLYFYGTSTSATLSRSADTVGSAGQAETTTGSGGF
jgi:Flp pilus assembly pilin Flp